MVSIPNNWKLYKKYGNAIVFVNFAHDTYVRVDKNSDNYWYTSLLVVGQEPKFIGKREGFRLKSKSLDCAMNYMKANK
jgi:hypothetical protein